jgi:ATP-dependent protease Clp ATPase subunit
MRRMRRPLTCSFCGRAGAQVQRLIAGPRVFICDECVARCNAILAEHPLPPAPGATREVEPPPPRSWARRLVDWWLVPSSANP